MHSTFSPIRWKQYVSCKNAMMLACLLVLTGLSRSLLITRQLLELRKLENELPTVDDSNSALTALLQDCWQLEPSLRPSFVEINIRLSRMQHLGDDDDGNNDDDDVNPPQPERSLSTGEVELEMLPTSSTPRSLPRHLQRHPNLESDDDLTPASEFESYGSLLDVGFAQRMRQK